MTSPLLWTLIAVQLALGLFDIIYHHEMMERLAWRASQRRELKLHGARNLAYAVLFLGLGLFELNGFWAMVVISVLAAEVVITLTDFVEEDLSRQLPGASGSRTRCWPSITAPSSRCSFPFWSAGQGSRPQSFRFGTASAACWPRWRQWE
jgi:hypothetical protein